MIKLWKLNESDWCAAETLEGAKEALANMVNDGNCGPDFDENYIDDPHEVTAAEMDRLKLIDDDELSEAMEDQPGDDKDAWKKRHDEYMAKAPTFRQALQKMIDDGETFPCHFASSEI